MNPLQQLQALGQSVWYDNIRRGMLRDGTLARYRDELAVTGVTSNPTIFEKALSAGHDYDAAVREAVAGGERDPEAVFTRLAIADIREAADVLRPVWERTGGADGFACLEVPPYLAYDTMATVARARQLFEALDRPNVMIKVPGTRAGVPAIATLIEEGVNVNVTLLFSVSQWEAVADAYLEGLRARQRQGRELSVRSVASFFISRIDKAANPHLPEGLHNRAGVVSGALAYGAWLDLIETDLWRRLAAEGAAPQRLLWASTSTKDPALPPTYYVEGLAARDTVNTMPEVTLHAFAEDGHVGAALSGDRHGALEEVARMAEAGVDLERLGVDLQEQGVQSFASSYEALLSRLEKNMTAAGEARPEV